MTINLKNIKEMKEEEEKKFRFPRNIWEYLALVSIINAVISLFKLITDLVERRKKS